MKAAVLHHNDTPLRIDDLEIEPPKAGEVAIRVAASGVCHSDLSVVRGIVQTPLPIVLGHEAAGIVEAVGEGVTHLRPGDHVIATLTPCCGECPMCREEKPFLCEKTRLTMGQGAMPDGTTRLRHAGAAVHQFCAVSSFAERSVIPAGALVKIDDDVPLDVVCLIGCAVTTGVGAVLNTAKVERGASVAVIGCGGVGLSIVQGARIAGADPIIAVDPVEEKRTLARSLGATHAIDPAAGDVVKQIRRVTGSGVAYAFEAIGNVEVMAQAWGCLRPSGVAVIVGVSRPNEEIKLRAGGLLQQKAIMGSVYGSAVPQRDVPRLVDLYRKGELRLEPMITRRIRLEQVNEAFDAMSRGEGARSVIRFD
ncbi:MAG: S-(hydroxymethyl)glutathione dehydrogenase / alcohol dehydrogenase [Candidatus Binatota bacterium]|nr:S-(hydroxymethyl)glutathione dehydrogenase / alcohol dehydrogenase [Candidatus Binatota bacterium]